MACNYLFHNSVFVLTMVHSFNNTSGFTSAVTRFSGGLCLPPGDKLLQLQEHIHQFVDIINSGEADTFLKITSAGLITHSLLDNLLHYSVEDLLVFFLCSVEHPVFLVWINQSD